MKEKKDKLTRYMGTYIKKEKGKRFHISFSYEIEDGKIINEKEVNRVELKENNNGKSN
jgi:hypothetical protein